MKLSSAAYELDSSFSSPPTPEAALRELLRGADDYVDSVSTLAAYRRERISMPESLHGSPDVLSLLPDDARHYLEAPERMLRPEEDSQCDIVPYWDPALRNSSRAYKDLIRHLHKIGYLDFTLEPKERAGIFFVNKANDKIRLIIDGRRANARFRDPPGVSLATAEAFARFEMEDRSDQDPVISVGLSDVKDCFHRMAQPRWLREYFALDPIPACWVGLQGTSLGGITLACDDLIYPMPAPLCMGCSWSLFFAQKANQHIMGLVPALQCSRSFSDRSEPVVFNSEALDGSSYHFVYVDNLGILSESRQHVETAIGQVTEAFHATQLLLHPGEVKDSAVDSLGCRLEGRKHSTRLKPARFHRVRQATLAILDRGRCTGRVMEIIVGHLTYSFLIARPLLAIFDHCYRFIRRHYTEKAKLWAGVQDELRAAVGGLIFCQADWKRQWNTVVSSSDASLSGYGVCTSTWPLAWVQKVGRMPERERFRRSAGHSARESALESHFIDGDLQDWSGSLRDSGWRLDDKFPEVPSPLLASHRWSTKLMGTWHHAEGIFELESLALLKSLVRIAKGRFGRDTRQLLLVDNMAVALAFSRARSRNTRVLRIIRKFNAWCLGRNIAASIRWIPSELNSADAPSRYADGGPKAHSEPSKHIKETASAQNQDTSRSHGPCFDAGRSSTSRGGPSSHTGDSEGRERRSLHRERLSEGQACPESIREKLIVEHDRSRTRAHASSQGPEAAGPQSPCQAQAQEVSRWKTRPSPVGCSAAIKPS